MGSRKEEYQEDTEYKRYSDMAEMAEFGKKFWKEPRANDAGLVRPVGFWATVSSDTCGQLKIPVPPVGLIA